MGFHVTFWNWRRGGGATATAGSSAMAVAPDLAPIELYTADTRIVGWIAANGRRVTDLLNAQDELRCGSRAGTIRGALAPLPTSTRRAVASLMTEQIIRP